MIPEKFIDSKINDSQEIKIEKKCKMHAEIELNNLISKTQLTSELISDYKQLKSLYEVNRARIVQLEKEGNPEDLNQLKREVDENFFQKIKMKKWDATQNLKEIENALEIQKQLFYQIALDSCNLRAHQEGSRYQDILPRVIADLTSYQASFELSLQDGEEVNQLLKELESAFNFFNQYEALLLLKNKNPDQFNEKFSACIQDLKRHLSSLKSQETLLLPIGDREHSVLFGFEKINQTYRLFLINTGEGVEKQQGFMEKITNRFRNIEAYDIPQKEIEQEAFLKQALAVLWDLDEELKKSTKTTHAIRCANFIQNTIELNLGRLPNKKEVKSYKLQKSGTCTTRPLMKYITQKFNLLNNKRFKAYAAERGIEILKQLVPIESTLESFVYEILNYKAEPMTKYQKQDLSCKKMIELGEKILLNRQKKLSSQQKKI